MLHNPLVEMHIHLNVVSSPGDPPFRYIRILNRSCGPLTCQPILKIRQTDITFKLQRFFLRKFQTYRKMLDINGAEINKLQKISMEKQIYELWPPLLGLIFVLDFFSQVHDTRTWV